MESSDKSCTYVNILGTRSINTNCSNINDYYDRAKALEESKRLLDLISSPSTTTHKNPNEGGNFVLSTCYFCKTLMPGNINNQCKLCSEIFCGRHKSEINHNCEKLSKDTAKYLNAKNQFKLRLREAKSKAVR